jgi:hypothetical protein
MKKISICVPTATLKNVNDEENSVVLLKNLLSTIENQTFDDYDVIISDHSIDDKIESELNNWTHLDLKYYRNKEGIGSPAINMNYAISKSKSEFIKIMFQDDFFCDNQTLEFIYNNIENYKFGFVGSFACSENNNEKLFNSFLPHWISVEYLLNGINTFGGPSTMFFKNEDNFFDTNLCWLNDTEFYYRLYKKYGNPLLITKNMVVQRLRNSGLSNTIPTDLRNEEVIYVRNKHTNGEINIEDYPHIHNRIKKYQK